MMWVWICLGVLFAIELFIANDICEVYQRLLNDEKAFKLALYLSAIYPDLAYYEISHNSFTDVDDKTFDMIRTIAAEAKLGKKTWKDVTDFAYMHGIKLIIETKKKEDK